MLESIKAYIYSLMLISLASGIVLSFSPGDKNGIKKYIQYIISLIIIITLILPFKEALYTIPKVLSDEMGMFTGYSYDTPEASVYDKIISMGTENVEKGISSEIKSKHGVDIVDLRLITDSTDVENIIIKEIEIDFPEGVSDNKAYLICTKMSVSYMCKVTYSIDLKNNHSATDEETAVKNE